MTKQIQDNLEDVYRYSANIAKLTKREDSIVRMFFGLGGSDIYTLKEIAEVFKISSARVFQLKNRALGQLNNRYYRDKYRREGK